jgi:hypothetical protein
LRTSACLAAEYISSFNVIIIFIIIIINITVRIFTRTHP